VFWWYVGGLWLSVLCLGRPCGRVWLVGLLRRWWVGGFGDGGEREGELFESVE